MTTTKQRPSSDKLAFSLGSSVLLPLPAPIHSFFVNKCSPLLHPNPHPPTSRSQSRSSRSSSLIMMHAKRPRASSSPNDSTMTKNVVYVIVDDPSHDTWKVQEVVDILRDGGVGVIPTDTSYAFVCGLKSRKGVDRIYAMKGVDPNAKKPLSVLCRDVTQIQKLTFGIDKALFKILKNTLPGPYTYILPATSEVPRVILEHKVHRKVWKRKEIGVRIPKDPYCAAVLDMLDEPLLSSSVPLLEGSATLACYPAEIGDNWCHKVDFVVDAGERRTSLSTVIDFTKPVPEVIRLGEGPIDFLDLQEEED